ncbi:MAG TPA: hypothetical protein VFE58_17160 [Tepidisphaeraceae bacterium]|jgi:hypothetical protein|nr:hypothetical protein [Tepidisphaeraceae bacterium]
MTTPTTSHSSDHHVWRFFRAGGFDQVRLDRGSDLVHLAHLDQKLWVALACPVHGLEFDVKTLQLIDTDNDGRIRAPEILAATQWALSLLKSPDQLLDAADPLPLSAINDSASDGKRLLASARQILSNLGKPDADSITVDDTADTAKIFALTRFNGDGIIPVDASDDPAVRAVIEEILKFFPALQDRSGKPGVDEKTVEQFFKDCQTFSDWHTAAETAGLSILPLGADTLAAAELLESIEHKIDDYFARCRLAAYDGRALGALNRQESDYLALAARDLTITSDEIAILPLTRIEASKPLALTAHLNPAWHDVLGSLARKVIYPLLGQRDSITEQDWISLKSMFAPYEQWLAQKPLTAVDSLGLVRVREILSSNASAAITDLLAQDKALEPEATAIADVDRLTRYHRDLHKLLNNFVNFRDFYARRGKALFQAGTLYLDQRSCDLCIRVEDAARHGAMAHLSQAYLAYCDLTRRSTTKAQPAVVSTEKITIACAFTAGDSDNLMVGRNGIFYDHDGNDWDATITKIVDNPISIRQAFWAPYKRAIRWVEDQIAKRAAAADAANTTQLTRTLETTFENDPVAAAAPAAVAPVANPMRKMDIGVVAAIGVAVGALTTALGIFLNWLSGTGYFLPIYIALVMLAISLPSMVIAALKLRQRNLGPLLDANGWAVNSRARINIPFGRSLTRAGVLPKNAKRDLSDPYADTHTGRNIAIAIAILLVILTGLWHFGVIEKYAPGLLPTSHWYEHRHSAIAGHFDGKNFVPDQPVNFSAGQKVTLHVAPATSDNSHPAVPSAP